jgi:hypothetical protein
MAVQYADGFASLGKAAGEGPGGARWAADEFLGTLSGAIAVERWVIGVRGAPSRERANAELERMRQGIIALPEAVRTRAVPGATSDAEAGGEYGAAEPEAPAAGEREAGEAPPAEEDGRGAPPSPPGEESSDEY